jgi:Ala-tRNA(Pro) deacylase
VDRSLEADEEIVFNAGTHRDAIRMKYADFKRLVSPRVADFAAKG